MTAVSGISYPLASQALHLQLIGWILPLYWLGLGMRSAMLPGGVAVTEIGDSWRSAETAAVLGLWAGSRPRTWCMNRSSRDPVSAG
jgi:ABC-2 type transport system permease protein